MVLIIHVCTTRLAYTRQSNALRTISVNSFGFAYFHIASTFCIPYLAEYCMASFQVDILDTSGDMQFPAMRRLSIATAHAFLLVYATTSAPSFGCVKQCFEEIREQRADFQVSVEIWMSEWNVCLADARNVFCVRRCFPATMQHVIVVVSLRTLTIRWQLVMNSRRIGKGRKTHQCTLFIFPICIQHKHTVEKLTLHSYPCTTAAIIILNCHLTLSFFLKINWIFTD